MRIADLRDASRLRAVNAEMLAALKHIEAALTVSDIGTALRLVIAAIAKAESRS